MSKKQRKFADDGWAVWVDGENNTTVYINDWLNPKGDSYVDLAIRVRGIKSCKALNVYVPFSISLEEIDDVSLLYNNNKILHAIFSSTCIIDYKKNPYTSEIAYNGKVVDVIHISTLESEFLPLANGTLITINLEQIQSYIDNDEAYFVWRMPHKTLNAIFRTHFDIKKIFTRLRILFTTPVVAEKYCYSIRVNESRLLPEKIAKVGAFRRQKLKKAVVTISIDESYEINDSSCYIIRRLEDKLYENYLPKKYKSDGVITYQWIQNKDYNAQGHFNFYYNISKSSIRSSSLVAYLFIIFIIAIAKDSIVSFFKSLF